MKYSIRDLQQDFPDEESCLEWLVDWVHPNGVTCRSCEAVTKHYRIKDRKAYSCGRCGTQTYPMAGTILANTKIPLTLWFYVIFVMANAKSGVSSAQIARQTGVNEKTALRMTHQIRKMMNPPIEEFKGEVEMDETFCHANVYKRSTAMSRYGYTGSRTGEILFGMVERDTGRAKVFHVRSAGARVIKPIIYQNVKESSVIHSDGYQLYRGLGSGYEHRWTNHGAMEFYTESSHTQNIENLWGGFKRGLKGVYRSIHKDYLQAYANEFAWRYSNRNSTSMFWALMGQVSKPS